MEESHRSDLDNEIPVVSINILDPLYLEANETSTDTGSIAKYKISGGIFKAGQPVHENITLAALIAAKVIDPTTYNVVIGGRSGRPGQPEIAEYLRGVIWNDDPQCSLFLDSATSNFAPAVGAAWLAKFVVGEHMHWERAPGHFLKRSHFGDLQFLHAMSTAPGEEPEITRANIMLWLEIMYKLSIGGTEFSFDQQVGTTALVKFFHEKSDPLGTITFGQMLQGEKMAYKNWKPKHRALGSCFHLIQDSFAVAHCKRTLLNPKYLEKSSKQYPIKNSKSCNLTFLG